MTIVLFVDQAKGFGGKYGVQTDRQDKVSYKPLIYTEFCYLVAMQIN